MRFASKLVASIGLCAALLCGPTNTPLEPLAAASGPAKVNYTRTLAGANTTGYVIDLGTGDSQTLVFDRFTQLTISVNGSTGDYWVLPLGLDDGSTVPSIPTDPRPGSGVATGWVQVKSGESLIFGISSSSGYNASAFTHRYYTHVLVWCQAAGTITATQLRIIGS